MLNFKNRNLLYLLCIITVVLFFYGCSNQNQQNQPNQQSEQENTKNPDKLKEIEKNVEAMIGMLSGVPNEAAKDQQKGQQQEQQQGQQQETQQSKQQGQKGAQQGQQGNQEGQQQETQQSKQQGQQGAQKEQQEDDQKDQKQGTQQLQQENQQKITLLEQKPDVNWKQALQDVEKIHIQWNDYVSQAAKDGVPKNNIDGFSNTLNEITNQIGSNNRTEALLAANNLSLHLSYFWTIYDSKVPPDIKRLKHYIRNTFYYSDLLEWSKVEQNMNSTNNLFQSIRTTASKEKQQAINKVDFSIQELDKVVRQKNSPLIKLKGKLAVDNLMEMEKDMESSE